jgi:hypothetical protein
MRLRHQQYGDVRPGKEQGFQGTPVSRVARSSRVSVGRQQAAAQADRLEQGIVGCADRRQRAFVGT